ncbi:MAG: DUF1080 domain-containing protein [Verrucomicrobiales bacterium]|nr:DUF1080 domain-containing protein [Verrucomicrobiales bacterium]
MKNTLLTLAAVFGLLGSLLVQADESGKSLFNGKDLTGWKAPEGNIWWIVEDGILKVRSGPDQKGSILWSEEEFTDFAVTLDFKFGEGIIDSGVHVKSQDQIQIGISGSLKRDMTASPYIPGKGYPVEAEGVKELLKMDEWNTLKIEVKGMTYTSYLNGKKVMTYTSESGKEKGPIGLQLHGKRDMSIDFRNIKVVGLK